MSLYNLLIVGAGPGGIALSAEAGAAGISRDQVLVLEKTHTHNWAIRQLYPEQKVTTANYKGFAARCEGLLCIGDMTKTAPLQYFDRIIADYKLNLQYEAEVHAMRAAADAAGARFRVESSQGAFDTQVLAVGIGI